jgi:hypothetical protein
MAECLDTKADAISWDFYSLSSGCLCVERLSYKMKTAVVSVFTALLTWQVSSLFSLNKVMLTLYQSAIAAPFDHWWPKPTHLYCPKFTPFTSYSEVIHTLTRYHATEYSYAISTITGIASRSCPTHTDTEPGPGPSGTCTVDLQTCSYSQCIATTTKTLSCPPLSTDPCCTDLKTTTVYEVSFLLIACGSVIGVI